MNSWANYAIWWHVYPLGFGRLAQIEKWLDYELELGANGLQLGPVFASETHGYDTTDPFPHRSAPRRRRRLRRADRRRARKRRTGAARRCFQPCRAQFPGVGALVHRSGFRGARQPARARPFPARGAGSCRPGDGALARPRRRRVAARCRVRRSAPNSGGPRWGRVRENYPEAWFVGEYIQGDYPAILRETTLDSLTQYELWKAIWSSINDGNFFELAWALERHAAVLEAGVPMTFVGNHDVTRIASKLDDPRHLGHALAVLFTVGGIPSIYYGRRAGVPGHQGGPRGRRRRDPARLPGRSHRAGRVRLADLSPARAVDRPAAPTPLAHVRGHDRAPPHEHCGGADLNRRRSATQHAAQPGRRALPFPPDINPSAEVLDSSADVTDPAPGARSRLDRDRLTAHLDRPSTRLGSPDRKALK